MFRSSRTKSKNYNDQIDLDVASKSDDSSGEGIREPAPGDSTGFSPDLAAIWNELMGFCPN